MGSASRDSGVRQEMAVTRYIASVGLSGNAILLQLDPDSLSSDHQEKSFVNWILLSPQYLWAQTL